MEREYTDKVKKKLWRRRKACSFFLASLFQRRFRITFDVPDDLPQNILLLCNHESDFDPFLLYVAFPDHLFRFLMSEHLFRVKVCGRRIVGALAHWINEPIPAMRHVSDAHAVRAALATLKEGGNVAFFPTGEREWDGYTPYIPDSIGKFARISKVTVVTFNMQGLYYVHPRWGRKMRKLTTHGRVVNVYTPEQTAAMKPTELADCIRRDLVVDSDAWRAGIDEPTKGKGLAEWLEQVLFICPECGQLEQLHSQGSTLRCSCGLEVEYTDRDVFAPGAPFHTVHEWVLWETERFHEMMDSPEGPLVLQDEDVQIFAVTPAEGEEEISSGKLCMDAQQLSCGDWSVSLDQVQGLGLVGARKIIFAVDNKQYELRLKAPCCTMKYSEFYKHQQMQDGEDG